MFVARRGSWVRGYVFGLKMMVLLLSFYAQHDGVEANYFPHSHATTDDTFGRLHSLFSWSTLVDLEDNQEIIGLPLSVVVMALLWPVPRSLLSGQT